MAWGRGLKVMVVLNGGMVIMTLDVTTLIQKEERSELKLVKEQGINIRDG